MKSLFFLFACFAIFSCSSSDETTEQPINETMYFPPNDATTWETKTPSSLGWNENNIPDLLDYLEQKNSKSFIVLHNGKIVMEYYFNGHTATTPWYWASAGKTLTTAVVGIAEQENFINTNNKVSDYIGTGWTSTPLEKENLISNNYFLCGIALLLTYLMNAELPLFSLKFKEYSVKNNAVKYLFLLISLLLIFCLEFLSIPLIVLLYVLLSMIINYRKTRSLKI